jgi:arylsulfatase A-like enzyme
MNTPTNPQTRRDFLKTVGALGLGSALTSRSFGNAPAILRKRPPNILLLTTDQWHVDAFSYRGNPHVYTPQSDRIAARGLEFDCSYCSDPVCAPSRTSWLTGQMPVEHGVIGNGIPIDSNIIDFGQWFGDNGYETAMFGKWHTAGRDPRKSFSLYTPIHPAGQYADFSMAEASRSFLLSRGREKPFFLHTSLMNPHDICQTACLRTAGGEVPLPPDIQLPPLPDNFSARPPEPETLVARIRRSSRRLNERTWDETDWQLYRWNYYRNCEMVDMAIGRVLDALEASGEAENTLLIYTSDHGDGLGHHQMTTKAFLYEESARVPLIVSMPGRLPEGESAPQMTSGVDIFPTICEVAGISTPPGLIGRDILKQYEEGQKGRDTLVSSGSFGGWMARNDRYKLIQYSNSPTRQLFDLQDDPGETKNLIEETSAGGVVGELEAGLADFQSRLTPSPTLSQQQLERILPERFGS